jgi:hypothetical protein
MILCYEKSRRVITQYKDERVLLVGLLETR